MFLHHETKTMSTLLRVNSINIKSGLYSAFESSIVGSNSEIQFLRKLIANTSNFLNTLNIPGLSLSCRVKEIHRKPIVSLSSGKRCELGDLLVVVKYHIPSVGVEVKSIIYQIKLTKGSSLTCGIDQTQLNLLCNWPQFSFGKAFGGGPKNHSISPRTLEFGSFMLEPRNLSPQRYLVGKYRCYGICPYAKLVHTIGPSSVKLNSFPYTRGDAHQFFSHLVFEVGEHHDYQPVKDLVDALYRGMGLAPDPPDEFNGYWEETEDDGFAVIEIKVSAEEK